MSGNERNMVKALIEGIFPRLSASKQDSGLTRIQREDNGGVLVRTRRSQVSDTSLPKPGGGYLRQFEILQNGNERVSGKIRPGNCALGGEIRPQDDLTSGNMPRKYPRVSRHRPISGQNERHGADKCDGQGGWDLVRGQRVTEVAISRYKYLDLSILLGLLSRSIYSVGSLAGAAALLVWGHLPPSGSILCTCDMNTIWIFVTHGEQTGPQMLHCSKRR